MTTDTTSHEPDRSGCLYHYTSAQGLEGILRTRSIWATDAAFLNDRLEIRYAAEPLIERMSDYLAEHRNDETIARAPGSAPENRLEIMNSALDALKKFISSDRKLHAQYRDTYLDDATYVACFSEVHDQLGQWRGYGQHGYALGLTKPGLSQAASLQQVRYGRTAVEELCDTILKYFVEERRPGAHPGVYGFYETVNRIMPQVAVVKHDAFEQELEWRLVVTRYNKGPTGVRVRVGSTVVPYVECAFDQSAVTEIVIGPGGDFHSERAVRALLNSKGYNPDEVRISHSRAPFRG